MTKRFILIAAILLLVGLSFAGPASQPIASDVYSALLATPGSSEVRVGPQVVFQVTIDEQNRIAAMKIAGRKCDVDIDITRDVRAVVPKTAEKLVFIHEMYASNEDRIQIVDGRGSEPKVFKLDHEGGEDYTHVHYEISDVVVGNGINITEIQYAGSQPPREREIRVPLESPGQFQFGEWHISQEQPSTKSLRELIKGAFPTSRPQG